MISEFYWPRDSIQLYNCYWIVFVVEPIPTIYFANYLFIAHMYHYGFCTVFHFMVQSCVQLSKTKECNTGYKKTFRIVLHLLSNCFNLSTYFRREELLKFNISFHAANKEWSDHSTKRHSCEKQFPYDVPRSKYTIILLNFDSLPLNPCHSS